MNVFILSTGRCGTTTFSRACSHLQNFTSSHESRADIYGETRLNYPEDHIESDNRLSWFLGRLERKYGDDAFYVHLIRDRVQTALSSSNKDRPNVLIKLYARGIYINRKKNIDLMGICLDYYDTVNSNIEMFLQNKTSKITVHLESIKDDFKKFLEMIGAEGDLSSALKEWDLAHNATLPKGKWGKRPIYDMDVSCSIERELNPS